MQFTDTYEEYYRIIDDAKNKKRTRKDGIYYEEHHVIPKSLGGSNSWRNLVLLTPEEHYTCHCLLPDFCEGESKDKMLKAWIMMNGLHNTKGFNIKNIIGPIKYGKMRRDFIESITGDKHPGAKAVCKLDKETGELLEIYSCMVDAEKETATNKSAISMNCRGIYTSAGDYIWCYLSNYSEEKTKDLVELAQEHQRGSPKRIYRIDQFTGKILKEFESQKQAFGEIKISGIGQCCSGRHLTTAGSIWCYADEYNEGKIKTLIERIKNKIKTSKGVYRLDEFSGKITGEYSSMVEASKKVNVDSSSISKCCSGNSKTAKNSLWCLVKDYTEEKAKELLKTALERKKTQGQK